MSETTVRVGPYSYVVGPEGLQVVGGPRDLAPPAHHVRIEGANRVAAYRSMVQRAAVARPTDDLREIESADVSSLSESTPDALLAQLQTRQRTIAWAPGAGVLGTVAALYACLSIAPWMGAVLGIITLMAWIWLRRRDTLRCTVVVIYELDAEAAAVHAAVQDGFGAIETCHRVWHIESHQRIRDTKRSAGATAALKRTAVRPRRGRPPAVLRTNLIGVPTLPAGRQTLYLLPDRVLVFEGQRVASLGWDSLEVGVDT